MTWTTAQAYDIEGKLASLQAAPAFLRELLAGIPAELLKARRIAGKWTIHEHAVHLSLVDTVMIERLQRFKAEAAPEIVPFFPDKEEAEDSLHALGLEERLAACERERPKLIEAFRALAPADWNKQARHPEYLEYTPKIMLRHLVMHEQLHCYRIEQLWLTRDEFLPK